MDAKRNKESRYCICLLIIEYCHVPGWLVWAGGWCNVKEDPTLYPLYLSTASTVSIRCIHGVSPCFDQRREFHFPADRWVVMCWAVAAVDTGTHDTTTQDTQYTTTLSCEHYGSVLVTHTLAPGHEALGRVFS